MLLFFVLISEVNGQTASSPTSVPIRPSSMYRKYTAKWPHCTNINCFGTTALTDAEDYCMATPECHGFSFSTGVESGSGCYKQNCWPDEVNGYGSTTHDYYEKSIQYGAMSNIITLAPTLAPVPHMIRLGPSPNGGEYEVHNNKEMGDSGTYTIGMWVFVTSDYDGEMRFTHSRWWDADDDLNNNLAYGTTDGTASPPRDEWAYITEEITATEDIFEFSLYIGWPQRNDNGYIYVTSVSVLGPNGTDYIGNGNLNHGEDIEEERYSYGTWSIIQIEGNGVIPELPSTEAPTLSPTVYAEFFLKYVSKWPHCTNLECFGDTPLDDAKDFCLSSSDCDGFSFSHNSSVGGGCYKKSCDPDDVNGYGTNSHDYYVKMPDATR